MNPSTAALSIQRIGLATSSTPTFRAAHGLGDVRKLHPRLTFTPPPFRLPPGMSSRDHATESHLSHRGQRSPSTPGLDLRSPRDRTPGPDSHRSGRPLVATCPGTAPIRPISPYSPQGSEHGQIAPNTRRTQPNSSAVGRGSGASRRGPRGGAGRRRAGADTPPRPRGRRPRATCGATPAQPFRGRPLTLLGPSSGVSRADPGGSGRRSRTRTGGRRAGTRRPHPGRGRSRPRPARRAPPPPGRSRCDRSGSTDCNHGGTLRRPHSRDPFPSPRSALANPPAGSAPARTPSRNFAFTRPPVSRHSVERLTAHAHLIGRGV